MAETIAIDDAKPKTSKRRSRAKHGQNYNRHGLTRLKTKVLVVGWTAIDKRSGAAQDLLAWKNQFVNDLGGEENVSSQRLALVDIATRTKLYIDSLDAWLMRQPSLVRNRKKSILPVLRERQALADSLGRLLAQIGLERQQRPIKSLAAYIAERSEPQTKATAAPEDGSS